MNNSEHSIISIRNLCISNKNDVLLYAERIDIGFDSSVGLFGSSGRGKTTLMKVILGIDISEEWNIKGDFYLGFSQKMNFKTFCSKMSEFASGYLPQNITSCFFHNKTIYEHFYLMSRRNVVSKQQILLQLEEVNMCDRYVLDKMPGEFSVGQLQRIAIALILFKKPLVVFADEPTSALDIYNEINVYFILKELREKMNFSMLTVSHNINVLTYFADTIYYFNQSKGISKIVNEHFEGKVL